MIFGEGTFFEFNRLTLARVIMGLLISLILVAVARKPKLVPTRGQMVIEGLAGYVRDNVALDMLRPQDRPPVSPASLASCSSASSP